MQHQAKKRDINTRMGDLNYVDKGWSLKFLYINFFQLLFFQIESLITNKSSLYHLYIFVSQQYTDFVYKIKHNWLIINVEKQNFKNKKTRNFKDHPFV